MTSHYYSTSSGFHCNILAASQSNPKSKEIFTSPHSPSIVIGYDTLSASFKAFIMPIFIEYEAQWYHQASKSEQWREPMQEEIEVMHQNNTWSIVARFLKTSSMPMVLWYATKHF